MDDDDWSNCNEEEMVVPTIPSLPYQRYGLAEHQQILLPPHSRWPCSLHCWEKPSG